MSKMGTRMDEQINIILEKTVHFCVTWYLFGNTDRFACMEFDVGCLLEDVLP